MVLAAFAGLFSTFVAGKIFAFHQLAARLAENRPCGCQILSVQGVPLPHGVMPVASPAGCLLSWLFMTSVCWPKRCSGPTHLALFAMHVMKRQG